MFVDINIPNLHISRIYIVITISETSDVQRPPKCLTRVAANRVIRSMSSV